MNVNGVVYESQPPCTNPVRVSDTHSLRCGLCFACAEAAARDRTLAGQQARFAAALRNLGWALLEPIRFVGQPLLNRLDRWARRHT